MSWYQLSWIGTDVSYIYVMFKHNIIKSNVLVPAIVPGQLQLNVFYISHSYFQKHIYLPSTYYILTIFIRSLLYCIIICTIYLLNMLCSSIKIITHIYR